LISDREQFAGGKRKTFSGDNEIEYIAFR